MKMEIWAKGEIVKEFDPSTSVEEVGNFIGAMEFLYGEDEVVILYKPEIRRMF